MATGGDESGPERSLQLNIFDCSICLQTFTKPKVLPCGHTFCKNCLVTYVKGARFFQCPTCKRVVNLGREGVECLTDNISLANLRDDFASVTIIDKRGREVETPVRSPGHQVCTKHGGLELKYYCPSCEEVICGECIVDEHSTHGVTRLSKALEKQAERAKQLIDEGKSWVGKVREKIVETDGARDRLNEEESKQRKAVDDSVVKMKKALTQAVDTRADELRIELTSQFVKKRIALTDQKEELETLLATLLNSVDEVQRCISSGETIPLIKGRKVLQEVIQPLEGRSVLDATQERTPVFTPSLLNVPNISLGTVQSARETTDNAPVSLGTVQHVQSARQHMDQPSVSFAQIARQHVDQPTVSFRTAQGTRWRGFSKSTEVTDAVEAFIQSIQQQSEQQHQLDQTFPKMAASTESELSQNGGNISSSHTVTTNPGIAGCQDMNTLSLFRSSLSGTPTSSVGGALQSTSPQPTGPQNIPGQGLPQPLQLTIGPVQQPAQVFGAHQELSALLQPQGHRRHRPPRRGEKIIKITDNTGRDVTDQILSGGIRNRGPHPTPPNSRTTAGSNLQATGELTLTSNTNTEAEQSAVQGPAAALTSDNTNTTSRQRNDSKDSTITKTP